MNVREIKARVNLEFLAEHLGIRRKGRSWLCPFHDDRNPSFSIKGQSYRCFACGVHGDAFDLVARTQNCNFREAVNFICRFFSLPIPSCGPRHDKSPSMALSGPRLAGSKNTEPQNKRESSEITSDRKIKILTAFGRWTRLKQATSPSHPAFEYLRKRGISAETARSTGIGFVGNYGFAQETLSKKLSLAELQQVGLFNDKGNLRLYRHRLLFPYRFDGEVHCLQARNIDWKSKEDGPKEFFLGSPKLPFNSEALLNPECGEIWICEGAIDTLSALTLGFNAVGIPGASGFKREWVSLFDGIKVILALDADDAGYQGINRIVDFFASAGRHDLHVLHLPPASPDVNAFLTFATD